MGRGSLLACLQLASPRLPQLLPPTTPAGVEEATVEQLYSNRGVEVLVPVAGGALPGPGSLLSLGTLRESMQPSAWPLEAV